MTTGPATAADAPDGDASRAPAAPPSRLAVLFADLFGYSALMSRDEPGTLEFIVACSDLLGELCGRFGGTLVQTTGDGFLVVFNDVVQAVDFSVEFHSLLAKRQAGSATRARFRMGIHVGDVHHVNGSTYGHAVNVAARLQAEALPGTTVLSQQAYDEVRGRRDITFEAMGQPPLKNILEKIALYRIPEPRENAGGTGPTTGFITLVGTLAVRTAKGELAFPATRNVSGMLGYLALAPGMRQPNSKIASLLWPDEQDRTGRHFAECRRRLARSLGGGLPDMLVVTDGHVGLNELLFDTDLGTCETELRRGRVPSMLLEVPDWPDRILEGFEAIGPVYLAWLRVVRAGWRTRILSALSDLLARSDADSEVCRDAARAIIAIDPGNEAASAALITHHTARQNRALALEEFARLTAYLRARHGVRPGAAAQAAMLTARHDEPAAPVALRGHPVTAPPVRLLRLTVEPFAGGPADDHLTEGFRGELLANLARFREWSVTEGAGAGRDEPDPATHIGHYAVDGESLETAAGRVLRIRLRDLAGRRVVWSDELAVNLQDWAELQRSIVGRIAAHLDTYISADRLYRGIADDGRDVLSHDAWLRAEQIFARWTPDAAAEAEGLLRRIIARDDGFAPAYSSLASFRNVQHVVRPGLARDAVGAREAHVYAKRAVELDPLDARNQLAVAWTAALTEAFDRAAIHFDLAATLNPNNAATLVSCALGYAFIGQPDRAETLVAHVLRISPVLPDYQWCYIASIHFLAGQDEAALHAGRLSGDRIVDNPGWTAAALVRLGRLDEARRDFEALIEAVRPVWAGAGPPTAEAVLDWFTGAYPIRREQDRAALRNALSLAMRGQ